MKKLIAILLAAAMIFGTACAFAGDAEDILDELGEELEDMMDELEDEIEDAVEDADWDEWGEEADDDDDEDDDIVYEEVEDDGTLFGAMTGGWEAAADPTVTAELKALFDKGVEGLVGVNYVPLVYLGSQVVAGTNYAFLCQASMVVPDPVPEWAIVYLYQDLQGEISVLDITGFDVGAFCDYGDEEDE